MTKTKYKYPYKPRKKAHPATKELLLKSQLGLTLSPLNICLRKKIISQEMYYAANKFIFLYSKRFGASHLKNKVSHVYTLEKHSSSPTDEENEMKNNLLFKEIITLLQSHGCYDILLNTCVYERAPTFLKRIHDNSWSNMKDFQVFKMGLEVLVEVLRKI